MADLPKSFHKKNIASNDTMEKHGEVIKPKDQEKLCVGGCNALRWHMQCFALAHAMLCVGTCNALRWHLQCFALADAMLCV